MQNSVKHLYFVYFMDGMIIKAFTLCRPALKKENIEVPVSAAELEEMTPRIRPAPYTSQVSVKQLNVMVPY